MIRSHRQSLAFSRKLRVRGKLRAHSTRPRLTIFRSNKYTFLQVFDDKTQAVIAAVNSREFEKSSKEAVTKVAAAVMAADELANQLIAKEVLAITLDRGSYRYHGRVKAIAEALRERKVQV